MTSLFMQTHYAGLPYFYVVHGMWIFVFTALINKHNVWFAVIY